MTIVVQERGLRRKPGESVHLRDREKNGKAETFRRPVRRTRGSRCMPYGGRQGEWSLGRFGADGVLVQSED